MFNKTILLMLLIDEISYQPISIVELRVPMPNKIMLSILSVDKAPN